MVYGNGKMPKLTFELSKTKWSLSQPGEESEFLIARHTIYQVFEGGATTSWIRGYGPVKAYN